MTSQLIEGLARAPRNLALAALLLGASLVLAACGGARTVRAQGTPLAPGTDARIAVGKTHGSNMVELELDHLTPPERLGVGLSQYAVWIVTPGMAPSFAGTLDYDRDEQHGVLRATTPYEAFDVVVTAEDATIDAWPSDVIVLRRSFP